MNFMQQFFDAYGDTRVKGWFLMESPLPTTCLCILYTLIVTKIGPKWMETKVPLELRKLIIVYNVLHILISVFLFYEGSISGWLTFYSYSCQPVDYSNDPAAVRILRTSYLYFLSKFFELFDTIFFVLRKKNHQISTLHVIHHGIMPMSVWWGVKFAAGGSLTFFGFLNTFVHIIMYSYYLVSALGSQYKKFLWWKKYLTVLQMAQFIAVIVHASQFFFIDCGFLKIYLYVIAGHGILFFCLFYKFYSCNYASTSKQNGPMKLCELKNGFNHNMLTGMCFPDQEILQLDDNSNANNAKVK